MIVLVLNCGSSSVKYQLLDMIDENTNYLLAKGIVDRIGLPDGELTHKPTGKDKYETRQSIPDHATGIGMILEALTNNQHGVIKSIFDITAVGHRVAHGGEIFTESALITEETKNEIRKCIDLAPLHNPANLKGIESMEKLLSGVPQVAVFDTSFHQTMPKTAYLYGLPYEYYEKYRLRRYGFHGTSHKFVSKRACEILNVDFNTKKIITCHLGNGASICAINNGKSHDTSMGFTPVEGLIMGTRVGNLDVGALLYIMEKEKLSIEQTNSILNKKSGLLGISGVSSDMRDIEDAAWNKGNERAALALEMFFHRVRRYIGAYAAEIGGLDILIFTGGIGENGPETREAICADMQFMGIEFDKTLNDKKRGKELIISKPESKVTVMVVPTNEELVIATDTMNIINRNKK